jgi:Zn-dependent protease
MNGALAATLYQASTWVLPVVFAVTLHEAAHGFVAHHFGDDTAWAAGRVTANPLKHIDRFGTIVLPALLILLRAPFLFGYAKPVPVDFRRLDNPRRDMVWVALAGPLANVLMAITASVLFYGVALLPGGHQLPSAALIALLDPGIPAPHSPAGWVAGNLAHAVLINVVLCAFNMLPLPPLDGGRVAVGLLPRALAWRLAQLERYGIAIVLLLLFVLPWIGQQFHRDLDVLGWVVGVPAEALIRFVLVITGRGG